MNSNGSAPARILDDDLFFSDPADTHVIALGEPYAGSDGATVPAFRPGSRHSVTIRRVLSEVTKREWIRLSTQGPGIATDVVDASGATRSLSINVESSLVELLVRTIVAWTFVRSDGTPVPLTREWIAQIGDAGAWLEQAILAFYNRRQPTEAENRDFTTASVASTKDADPPPPAPSTSSPPSGSAWATPTQSDE